MSPVKKISITGLLLILFMAGYSQGSADKQVPIDSIQLRTLRGGMVSYGSLALKNPVILVCFWSVNNESSINELNAISAQYAQWKQRASFTLMAICVDEGSLVNRMRPTANQNGWTFDVYADISGQLQQALSFSSVPQAMVLNKGQVVYQQAGYTAGTENYLFNKVLGLAPVKK